VLWEEQGRGERRAQVHGAQLRSDR